MHPLCVVRSRVAISKLIDATTPGESRSNLAPALKTPKQLGPSLTPIRAVLHRAACWLFFARLNFVQYPNLLRWSWGFQHQHQFKDGLIRLWSFPSHPPMPLHSRLCFGLTRGPQAYPRLPQELFLCLFGCLMFGLIFLPVTQRAILDWDRERIPCTLLRNYPALL
jgi:hypothetical protein